MQEHIVSLEVTLRVWADHPAEAQDEGRRWVKAILEAADDNGSTSHISSPAVYPENPKKAVKESARPAFNIDEHERQQRDEARRVSGYRELLLDFHAAVTTDDYLTMQARVQQWLTEHKEPYHTPLNKIKHHLATFQEAIRWSEQHPNGPQVWNVGLLLVTIKTEVQREVEALDMLGV